MYTMTIDGRPFYDPALTNYAIEVPSIMLEANKIGTLTFTIYPEHPEYYGIIMRLSNIRLYRDGVIDAIFRPVKARRMFQGGMEYTCEEMTALLNDFLHRPAAFPVNPDANTARDLMQLCITDYNARSAGSKVVPPKEYVLSLYPFQCIGNRHYDYGGTLEGHSLEGNDYEIWQGFPSSEIRTELANVLAVLGYFGNVYIPPTYDWYETGKALQRFTNTHGLRYGRSDGYNYDSDYGEHILWQYRDGEFGWDYRVMDWSGIIAAFNADYQALIDAQPPDGEESDASTGADPITFSVGDTPAMYDSTTGDPTPITMEAGGYAGFWDYMQEAIVDQLGGYIIPEWRENSCILHYRRNEHLPDCAQAIEFGQNMVDLAVDTDSEKVYSIIIPLGKNGLTINNDDIEPDYIGDADAVSLYGKRETTREWPEITDRQQLKYTATQWLADNAIRLKDQITVSAYDLKYAGVNTDYLRFMHNVWIRCEHPKIEEKLPLCAMDIQLDSPAAGTYTLNSEPDSMSDEVNSK